MDLLSLGKPAAAIHFTHFHKSHSEKQLLHFLGTRLTQTYMCQGSWTTKSQEKLLYQSSYPERNALRGSALRNFADAPL